MPRLECAVTDVQRRTDRSQDHRVCQIIVRHITERFLGIFGELQMNVLEVNLAQGDMQTSQ